MAKYSIKDLEVLSGIKAHTLRIWEQRYNILIPDRTETNIREYTDEDLKLILNISLLNQNGFKISKIAEMSQEEVFKHVIQITDVNPKFPDQIQALTVAMIDLDETRFEVVISKNISQFGLEKTMLNVIYPFLSKIGLMWQTGAISPAQEHFITNLIRQKLISAIDRQYSAPTVNAKTFLLFLAEGELHELGLLFIHYIIKSRQQKSIYLGQSLPFEDLKTIFESHKPDYMITLITNMPNDVDIQSYIYQLGDTFKSAQLLISGYQVVGQDYKTRENTQIINKVDDLIELVDEINI
jgi:MerR family transcriptional regulator, light-induced transcriptional regulator